MMEPSPQTILDQWYIPPDTPEQRLHYYDRAADVYQEVDSDDEPITLLHDEELHEALYQVQLVTMAFQDGHYRTAAFVLDTAKEFRNLNDINVMLLAFTNLRELYAHVPRESDRHIANWLFRYHGHRMHLRINFISRYLRMPIPEDSPLLTWAQFRFIRTFCVCVKTPRNTGHTQDTLADSKNARLWVYRFDMQFSTTGGGCKVW